jgi:demethylmenaquinone methyltransferase/2-methoxy-6-polyprenyl-1,4-benzoquinol methylase
MSETIKPYQNSDQSKKEQVAQMFDTISGEYDGLNKIISLGTDASWKKKILQMVKLQKPTSILDIATGTGDLAILFAETSAKEIIGLDISQGMLDIGKKKIEAKKLNTKIQMVLGDGENIPYSDNYFDVITVAYGVRNFENLEKGLSEILRVLKPNGTFIILETSVPTQFPFKQGYYVYTNFIMPTIGKLFSKDQKAYICSL